MMDTLSAYMAGVDRIGLDRHRLALLERVQQESFGHPAHRTMLLSHETRVRQFYDPGTEPATDEQVAELLNASNRYKHPKKYTQKNKPVRMSADRQLQIAVEAATRKKAS